MMGLSKGKIPAKAENHRFQAVFNPGFRRAPPKKFWADQEP